MATFKRKGKGDVPGISTASLPDIVFMLLFFFMVSTTMKETSLKVSIVTPHASEVKKLERKSLVSFIYVGKPSDVSKYGNVPRIQLNDAFAKAEDIREYISSEREKMSEGDKNKMSVSLKADRNIEMGIIIDVKQELRKASALKINYSTKKGTQNQIFKNLR